VGANKSTRKIGLARALSKLGYCSRTTATGLIRAGRVSLNGTVRRDPETPALEKRDQIAVDGNMVEPRPFVYLMMNKPRGIITTASDEKGRATVYTVLASAAVRGRPGEIDRWVAPVGRLDKASEGLLLLTNDSEWAARIAAPASHLDKTYHVQLNIVADAEFLRALNQGTKAKDGEFLKAKRVVHLRSGEKNSWLEIVLDEGKNRQIRRMIEGMNVEILRLVRVAIGPLLLGDLAKGAHRALAMEEKRMLGEAMRPGA
jgi:23S rRNA pseudouridine2605 synthase